MQGRIYTQGLTTVKMNGYDAHDESEKRVGFQLCGDFVALCPSFVTMVTFCELNIMHCNSIDEGQERGPEEHSKSRSLTAGR